MDYSHTFYWGNNQQKMSSLFHSYPRGGYLISSQLNYNYWDWRLFFTSFTLCQYFYFFCVHLVKFLFWNLTFIFFGHELTLDADFLGLDHFCSKIEGPFLEILTLLLKFLQLALFALSYPISVHGVDWVSFCATLVLSTLPKVPQQLCARYHWTWVHFDYEMFWT